MPLVRNPSRSVPMVASVLLMLGAACGGTVDVNDDGATGSGSTSSGVGGSGTGGSLPEECQVSTSTPPPYATTFRFINPSGSTLWLRMSCQLEYDLTSCGDFYTESISRSGDCSVDCETPEQGCIACGACFQDGISVPAQGAYEDTWSGFGYTFGTTPDGCTCHNAKEARAGLYRVAATVYPTQEDAQVGNAFFTSTIDFELPAPGGVVELMLQP